MSTQSQNNRPTFRRAVKKRVKVKIAAASPSGGGKTESLLRIATGFVSLMGPREDKFQPDPADPSKQIPLCRIAFLDTQNDSGSLYAHKYSFDTLAIDPPFTVPKYLAAIKAAELDGYDFLIIDSISHAWAGEGGLLEKKDNLDAGNRKAGFNNWNVIGKEQNTLINAILQSDIHVGCTMRSKTAYILEKNDAGKEQPKKAGLAPIQRDGVEYEFTILFDMENGGFGTASKDRTGLFMGKNLGQITEEHGLALKNWLDGGIELTAADKAKTAARGAPQAQQQPQTQQRPQNQNNKPQNVAQQSTGRPGPTQNAAPQTKTQRMNAFLVRQGFNNDWTQKAILIEYFMVPTDVETLTDIQCQEFCAWVIALKAEQEKAAKDALINQTLGINPEAEFENASQQQTGDVPQGGGQ